MSDDDRIHDRIHNTAVYAAELLEVIGKPEVIRANDAAITVLLEYGDCLSNAGLSAEDILEQMLGVVTRAWFSAIEMRFPR